MKILVAVDGSKPALHAVKYAIDLSTKLSEPTHITLVSAHDDTGLRHVRKHVPAGSIQDHLRELSGPTSKPRANCSIKRAYRMTW